MEKGAKAIGCLFLSPFILIGSIFPIVGIILIIVGINLEIKMNNETQNYVETRGYYRSCNYVTTNDEGVNLYKLNYEYTVNGEIYVVNTDYSTNSIPNIGDAETIKYNPKNPSEAVIISNTISDTIMFIGAIFSFLPFVWILPIVIIVIIAKSKNIRTMERMNKEYQNPKPNKIVTVKKNEDNDNDDPIKSL